MAAVAGASGGDSAAVGIVHAIRVSATVAIVPFLVLAFGVSGDAPGVAPVIIGLILSVTEILTVAVTSILIIVAQLVIGAWLGCQFRREVLVRLPRVALARAAMTLFMIAAAYGGAWCLSRATDLPIATAFLALAPLR